MDLGTVKMTFEFYLELENDVDSEGSDINLFN